MSADELGWPKTKYGQAIPPSHVRIDSNISNGEANSFDVLLDGGLISSQRPDANADQLHVQGREVQPVLLHQ